MYIQEKKTLKDKEIHESTSKFEVELIHGMTVGVQKCRLYRTKSIHDRRFIECIRDIRFKVELED